MLSERQQRTVSGASCHPTTASLSSLTLCLMKRVGCYNMLILYCCTIACAVWSVWKLASASTDDRALDVATIPTTRDKRHYYFHRMRPDRSGAVIHDMLLAHAYAFAENRTYGGACSSSPSSAIRMAQHRELLGVLGLQGVLPFACPTGQTSTLLENDSSSSHLFFLEDSHTKRSVQRLWTPAWLQAIRSKSVTVAQRQDPTTTIVVHIRRGDVSVCDPTTRDRYLPNAHYLQLIEEAIGAQDTANTNTTTVVSSPPSVVIYSENSSATANHHEVESWSDFDAVAATLRLDTSPADAWRAMLQARVLILSKSSFSIVPALFLHPRATVVYTPFWVPPLPSWTVVDDTTDRQYQRTNLRLQHTLCPTGG